MIGRGILVARTPASRDLLVGVVAVLALSRVVDPPATWLVAAALFVAVLVGTLQVLADADPGADASGVPIEALITPSVAAVACLAALRLVPAGLWLIPALLASAWLIERTIATEARIVADSRAISPSDRTVILLQALVVAFLAFAGVATLVPGGLAQPGGAGAGVGPAFGSGSSATLPESDLLILAAVDALVAGLLGYRASALRMSTFRAALWSAATYASVIAIAAAAGRAMAIPRLVGPALLALVFFLWDAYHGTAPTRRREVAWIGQTVVLVVLGVVVVAWNLALR